MARSLSRRSMLNIAICDPWQRSLFSRQRTPGKRASASREMRSDPSLKFHWPQKQRKKKKRTFSLSSKIRRSYKKKKSVSVYYTKYDSHSKVKVYLWEPPIVSNPTGRSRRKSNPKTATSVSMRSLDLITSTIIPCLVYRIAKEAHCVFQFPLD